MTKSILLALIDRNTSKNHKFKEAMKNICKDMETYWI